MGYRSIYIYIYYILSIIYIYIYIFVPRARASDVWDTYRCVNPRTIDTLDYTLSIQAKGLITCTVQ